MSLRTDEWPPQRAHQTRKRSILARAEHRFVQWLLPHVPVWIQPQHLTLLTIPWSILVWSAYKLAAHDRRWLWVASACIGLQYVTDAIDGKLGRRRGAGLIGWGYYMDHLLDYVFLAAIIAGYATLAPPQVFIWLLALMAISGAFMASAFLDRSVTGQLQISYAGIGPIEVRLVFMAINAWLAWFGQEYMLAVMPYVCGGAAVVLVVLVYQTQSRHWHRDVRSVRAHTSGQTTALDGSATSTLEESA